MKKISHIIWSVILVAAASLLLVGCAGGENEKSGEESVSETTSSSSIADRIAANPNDPDLYYERAKMSYENGNYADATYDLARAMAIDSINEDYHILLSDVYLGNFESEMALRTMERSQRLFPQSKKTNLKMAELQIILKQYEEASGSIQRVMDVEPLNLEALQLLGVLYKERGDIENATRSFRRVVEIDGDNIEGWTMLGNLLDMQDDPSALQCFENAIAIDSTYPQGWHSKAFYLQNHGDMPQAIEIYEHIQSFAPDYLDAYLNAGILYLETGDAANARKEFESLLSIDESSSTGNYFLGVAYEQSGNLESALTYYERAAALSPRNVRFGEAVERMRIALNR